jgi:uncharacterized protein YbbC (DUF1343 family)
MTRRPIRLIAILAALVGAAQAPAAEPPVRTGLDVLVRDGCRPLAGKRVGIVTNPTGIDRERRHIVDLLHGRPGVTVSALFGPEHGIRGAADDRVESGRDEKTGLPVHSLYGKTRKPTPEMLADVDVLVFDIQDIGTRFYTYITTLAYCMEAAKAHDKAVVVLDRPNPIGGEVVEGPVLEDRLCGQFTGYHPIPTRHGMTVGELARLFNGHFRIGCRLEVVPMEGWRRSMDFDVTGLPWVNPSPNMRSVAAAFCYPGLGALEATTLSVGRGTERPFEWYGAPWLDGEKACASLNARGLAGVRFAPVAFTPATVPGMPRYPYTGTSCRGFAVEIGDRPSFRPVTVALHVMQVLRSQHPDDFRLKGAPGMIGRADVGEQIEAGAAPEAIRAGWEPGLEAFRAVRERVLLYR